MRFSVLLLPLALAACGVTPKPETRIQQVYCVTPQQYAALIAAEPAKIGQLLPADPAERDRIQTKQNVLVRQFADGLLRVIGGCTAPAP